MNISFTTNAEQDAVIIWKTNQYNAATGASLTPQQFVRDMLISLHAQWRSEMHAARWEALRERFLAANDAKKTQIETAAQ